MLSAPLICCSIGVATDCSMVCASAPTKVASTATSGGTMLGNWATGSAAIATAPMITVRIEITTATIGRLMKNLDIGSIAFRHGSLFDFHRRTVLNFLQSLYDHKLARVDAAFNDPHWSDTVPELHGPNAHLVLCADHCELISSLQLAHGFLWHEQCVASDVRRGPQSSKLARTE